MAITWHCAGCKYLKGSWYCTLHEKNVVDLKYCNQYRGLSESEED